MTWGYLPLPRKNWAVAYLLEWRDGFPFSVHDDDGRSVGAANSGRMPDYFNLNLHVEPASCSETSTGLSAAVSTTSRTVGIQTQVNDNASSPHFLTYYGGAGRSLNFRLRWLGKS